MASGMISERFARRLEGVARRQSMPKMYRVSLKRDELQIRRQQRESPASTSYKSNAYQSTSRRASQRASRTTRTSSSSSSSGSSPVRRHPPPRELPVRRPKDDTRYTTIATHKRQSASKTRNSDMDISDNDAKPAVCSLFIMHADIYLFRIAQASIVIAEAIAISSDESSDADTRDNTLAGTVTRTITEQKDTRKKQEKLRMKTPSSKSIKAEWNKDEVKPSIRDEKPTESQRQEAAPIELSFDSLTPLCELSDTDDDAMQGTQRLPRLPYKVATLSSPQHYKTTASSV